MKRIKMQNHTQSDAKNESPVGWNQNQQFMVNQKCNLKDYILTEYIYII